MHGPAHKCLLLVSRYQAYSLCNSASVLLSRDMGKSHLSSIQYNLFMNVPLSGSEYHKAHQIEDRTVCYQFEKNRFSFFIDQNFTAIGLFQPHGPVTSYPVIFSFISYPYLTILVPLTMYRLFLVLYHVHALTCELIPNFTCSFLPLCTLVHSDSTRHSSFCMESRKHDLTVTARSPGLAPTGVHCKPTSRDHFNSRTDYDDIAYSYINRTNWIIEHSLGFVF